jgi:hypothetical protein
MVEISSETAVLYSTGLFAVPVRWVLVRDPQGGFKTQALLCTDLDADPHKIVCWFVRRWQLEVTFQEVRRHLGFETQRQWSDLFGDQKNYTGSVGPVLVGHYFCTSPDEAGSGRLSASSSLVPQGSSDLRRCAGAGAQRVVGPGADFLRVALGDRHDKSPTGLCGTTNQRSLLRSVNG